MTSCIGEATRRRERRVRGEEGEEKREPITKDRQEEERMREGIRKGRRNRGER